MEVGLFLESRLAEDGPPREKFPIIRALIKGGIFSKLLILVGLPFACRNQAAQIIVDI